MVLPLRYLIKLNTKNCLEICNLPKNWALSIGCRQEERGSQGRHR